MNADPDPRHWIIFTDRNGILYLGLGKTKNIFIFLPTTKEIPYLVFTLCNLLVVPIRLKNKIFLNLGLFF